MWTSIFKPSINNACVNVIIIPCWEDNYAYIVYDEKTKKAVVIDAVEPDAFKNTLETEGLELVYILTTHHHDDHSAGNAKLHELYPQIPIIGIKGGKTPNANQTVENGQDLSLTEGIKIRVEKVPCHTMDHVTFTFFDSLNGGSPKVDNPNKRQVIFTGDFLFIGGCGRFYEGTPSDMYSSIKYTYENHSLETYMFSGHEYGLNNLLFARHFEPTNQAVLKRLEDYKRSKTAHYGEPSSLVKELTFNPFVRCVMSMNDIKSDFVRDAKDGIELLGNARKMKDEFVTPKLE